MELIKDIIAFLEQKAPLSSQESYDNSGLIVGDRNAEVKGILIALDCIESVVEEAVSKNCNLIIAHHPILFRGVKSLTGKDYVERTLLKAIKNDIAIYAIHTNLDNYRFGVNFKIGELLGLENLRVLSPKKGSLVKCAVFVPKSHHLEVQQALFEAGAGHIGNYDSCSFSSEGTGTFRANEQASPYVGKQGEFHQESEVRLEFVFREDLKSQVIKALKSAHPYEEIAYDLYPLLNIDPYQGAGMIGELANPVATIDFLHLVKEKFKCGVIRHTELNKERIQRVAFCGGSGSFLLGSAKAQNADIFITADYKYHEFFDAENQIVIADIGHYESEQFTVDLLCDWLKEKNSTFAVRITEINTNPVKYL